MSKEQIKHVFPGGNTPEGFFSYYQYIIPATARRIFLIKGGPGTGKSSFMKKISAEMMSLGYALEHHHCSSDPHSLDGLVIPALNVAFMDGTATHIVDPKNPGCVDEIIYLGNFWNENKIEACKSEIIACNQDISLYFQRSYRYLRAAKSLYDDWENINLTAFDTAEANKKTQHLLSAVFRGAQTTGSGKVRKLFASAITPEGSVHYLDSLSNPMSRNFVITGQPGTGKSTLVQRIIDTAIFKGLDVEAYYCPLDPHKPEHVLIPALQTAVLTSVFPHTINPVNTEIAIDMNECLLKSNYKKLQDELAYNRFYFMQHFHEAIAQIRKAKQLHDVLETYYVPNMNFTAVQELWEKTLHRLLSYSKENPPQ